MISPQQLLEAIGASYQPTAQQAAIIAADPTRPAVVIAGAGSGKTTTMSDRVLWLVANGLAEPHQILGLTFTRKAAASLNSQIQRGLGALRASGLAAVPDGEPTVLTYHSYGARVMQEHALRLGIEPTSRTLRDAANWQISERIVSGVIPCSSL
jgi:DNA helicase-2/ATP-dependent DNA helicase PcrA